MGVIYRPPDNRYPIDHFNSEFDYVLNKLSVENKVCYLLGDYNIDLLKEKTHKPISDFLSTIYSYSFFPTINKPTRITRTSATIIDNIITNNSIANHQSGIFVADISDHLPIFVQTDIKIDDNDNKAQNKTKN